MNSRASQPGTDLRHSVLIINQHGDNRGDEAAMRAVIRGLHQLIPDTGFTVLHQFTDPASRVDIGPSVTYRSLRLPPTEALRLVLFTVLFRLGVSFGALLGQQGREIADAYHASILVVCAPGGPYFGDIYADHEVVHWFYVWLAVVFERPVVLYAPSVGPFRHRLLNLLRRRGFRWFQSITLREAESREMLSKLTGGSIPMTVAADAAFQESPMPAIPPELAIPVGGFLTVVAVRDPGGAHTARHDAAILAAISVIRRDRSAHIVFLPQLHGPRHRDYPYLQALADKVEGAASVSVVRESLDSDGHRALVASADIVVAGRYHPAVFAVSAGVPALLIAYEHKVWGLAKAAGIERWAVDVTEIDADHLADLTSDLLGKLDVVRDLLQSAGTELMERSHRSNDLAITAIQKE